MDYYSLGYGGMGRPVATRTPISFGGILDKVMGKIIPDMKRIKEGNNEQYLFYLYYKNLGKGWNGFAMFQAARRRGAFIVEVAVGKRMAYPSYWADAIPDYSIDGVRDRLAHLVEGEDKWWLYSSAHELENTLETVIRGSLGEGIHALYESHIDRIDALTQRWIPKAQSIREKVRKNLSKSPVEVFPDLSKIEEAYKYVRNQVRLRTFEKLFPPFIREIMRGKEFMMVQSALMSEILNMPDVSQKATQEEEIPPYQDDIIEAINGVAPRSQYMVPVDSEEEALFRYAYFLSLSILESTIGMEEEEKKSSKRQG